MKIIDFDFEFRQYLEKWIEDNADSYGDYDEMETEWSMYIAIG